MGEKGLFKTEFEGLGEPKRGKVRDVYELGENLLMVASDRISAFDVVMNEPVPEKGKILNRVSLRWFRHSEDLMRNHVVTADISRLPEKIRRFADILEDRFMLVKKAEPLPAECIVRGYITGSGWNDYLDSGKVCGIPLPPELLESQKLDEPLFTPSTKADQGKHDINIDFKTLVDLIGEKLARQVRDFSLELYNNGAEYAKKRGIIIADTKFEFGLINGELVLIDELLTPDSSRFWPMDGYKPGQSQPSFDKQYLRDYLKATGWNKQPPPPPIPEAVLENTRVKYIEAEQRLS